MDFTLTDEQELLRETARRMLRAECPASLVREHMADRAVRDRVWPYMSEWTALAHGPLVDLCLFLEETGVVLAPGPFFATTVLFEPLVAAEMLSVSPGTIGTVAMAGASGEWVPNQDPVKTFVLDADAVDAVAFVVGAPGAAGVGLVRSAELEWREVATLDASRRVFDVTVPDGLTVAPVEAELLEGLLERAWVALSAEMLGTARWILEQTLEYARQREQFGRPIGSFQAVQHKLANMALATERAWAATYYAAMTIDADDGDRRRAAHVAKAMASSATRLVTKDGMQVHGGIGFTYEHDLHLFIRRVLGSEHLLGTADWHEDRLGELLFA